MSEKRFETALGIAEPWHVSAVDLDTAAKTLTSRIDFAAGSRFAMAGKAGFYPAA